MQDAVEVDDLDQLGGAELVEQLRDVDRAGPESGAPRARSDVARTDASSRCCCRWSAAEGRALAPGILQPAGDLAQRGQAVRRIPRRPGAVPAGRPARWPASAQLQASKQPGPVSLRGVTLRERSQLGPVGGGLCPQLRGAQRELELIQDRQPAAAGGEQAARVARPPRPAVPRRASRWPGTSRGRAAGSARPRRDGDRRHGRRPRSSATRPASRCAWVASAEPSASSRPASRSAARSNWADTGRPHNGPGASTSPAWACPQAFC